MATDVISCNSSYVLIITTPFRRISERAGARPPATRVSILYCQGGGGSGDGKAGAVWRVFYLTEKLMLSDPAEICKIRGSVESATLSGSSKAKSPVLEDNGLIVESIIELL